MQLYHTTTLCVVIGNVLLRAYLTECRLEQLSRPIQFCKLQFVPLYCFYLCGVGIMV